MTEFRKVHPLLGGRIRGIANLPEYFGARRFVGPSYGGMTGTVKSIDAQLMQHDGSTYYKVARGSQTPRLQTLTERSVRFDCGTYRLAEEIERVTADSGDVAGVANASDDYRRVLAEQARARMEGQAKKGAHVYQHLEIGFELEVGATLSNSSLWTHSATLSGTSKFSHASSDPIKRLEQLVADTQGRKLAMGHEAWRAIAHNEKVRASIAGTKDAHALKLNDFQAFAMSEWMIEEVVIGRARYKNDAGTYAYCWGDWVHCGSPGENLVPVGQEFTINQESLIRVVNPVPDQSEMRGRAAGVDGDERDGYLVEILDDADSEESAIKLSRRGVLIPLIGDAGGVLLDVA